MLLKLAALIILLHGLIHIIGVVTFWKLGLHDQYSTKIWDTIDLRTGGTYVLGFVWLVVTVAYAIVAYGMFRDLSWWQPWLAYVTILSLVLTLLGGKGTTVGTIFNVVTLVLLYTA